MGTDNDFERHLRHRLHGYAEQAQATPHLFDQVRQRRDRRARTPRWALAVSGAAAVLATLAVIPDVIPDVLTDSGTSSADSQAESAQNDADILSDDSASGLAESGAPQTDRSMSATAPPAATLIHDDLIVGDTRLSGHTYWSGSGATLAVRDGGYTLVRADGTVTNGKAADASLTGDGQLAVLDADGTLTLAGTKVADHVDGVAGPAHAGVYANVDGTLTRISGAAAEQVGPAARWAADTPVGRYEARGGTVTVPEGPDVDVSATELTFLHPDGDAILTGDGEQIYRIGPDGTLSTLGPGTAAIPR